MMTRTILAESNAVGSPAASPLDYAKRPRRRRPLRILMLLLIAVAAGMLWFYRAPLTAYTKLHYAQHQCANHNFPPDTLVASTGGRTGEFVAPPPACWTDYQASGLAGFVPTRPNFSSAVVFLHRLRSPAGTERIVALNCYPLYLSSASVLQSFEPVTVAPADPWAMDSRPVQRIGDLNGGYPIGIHIEVFGGQADPNDASRFTVGYAIQGTRGVIDGQLLDDGTVDLKIRSGSPDAMDVYRATGWNDEPRL